MEDSELRSLANEYLNEKKLENPTNFRLRLEDVMGEDSVTFFQEKTGSLEGYERFWDYVCSLN